MAEFNTLNQQIGARIRYFRRDRNYTITQLGQIICKSKSTISKYETGEISIDVPTLYDIAHALQVPLRTLLPHDETETLANPVPPSGTDESPEKFYLYTYNGLAKEPLRRHILLVGSTYAEHFADVYDYENYTQCAYHYRGEVERTESSVRLFMKNSINPLDSSFLIYPVPLSQREFYTGLLTSFSISHYPAFSIKFLLSHEEQTDEQWLKEQLILTKEELKHIKKKNIFYVIDSEMEEQKI